MRPIQADVPGLYVSVDGLVYSDRQGPLRPLSLRLNVHGYPTVQILRNGKRRNWLVHRLVAEEFLPNPENLQDVNHKNGIKQDNRVENLEWCSRSDNIKHAFKLGLATPTRGRLSGRCKLSVEDVEFIAHSTLSARKLANMFGVSNQHICRIRLKQRRYDATNKCRY